jgi:hypothetical protein
MSTKRKRDVSSQELNRHLVTATTPSSNHQITTTTIQPSAANKKMKKSTATGFIQSLPLNSISVNKNYPFVFYISNFYYVFLQLMILFLFYLDYHRI